jgi:hypothetical protein
LCSLPDHPVAVLVGHRKNRRSQGDGLEMTQSRSTLLAGSVVHLQWVSAETVKLSWSLPLDAPARAAPRSAAFAVRIGFA